MQRLFSVDYNPKRKQGDQDWHFPFTIFGPRTVVKLPAGTPFRATVRLFDITTSVFHSHSQKASFHKQGGDGSLGVLIASCSQDWREIQKTLKIQDINGTRSLHLHCKKATFFQVFITVVIRMLLWSGCILQRTVVRGDYPSLSAFCWGRKQREGPGTPWRRGL